MNMIYSILLLFLPCLRVRGFSSIDYNMTSCLVDGVIHETGSTWDTQTCSMCTCYMGMTICSKKECPKLNCFDSYKPHGKCCPICYEGDACLFKGNLHKSGTEWTIADGEPCVTCRCNDGLSSCVMKECPKTTCDNPIKPEGECCPHCNDLPCVFNGNFHNHTSKWTVDECTECACYNGRVSCSVDNCDGIPSCENPVVIPNSCCPVCPHKIEISKVEVKTAKRLKLKVGRKTDIVFSVKVNFNKDMSEFDPLMAVMGKNLWKISAWLSKNKRGTGRRFSYSYQILNQRQSSIPAYLNTNLEIPHISYTLKSDNLSCKQLRFFCVNFDTADLPQYSDKGEAFTLVGYPTHGSLTGCKKVAKCKETKRSVFRKSFIFGLQRS